jgi:hypothetical protein
VGWAELTGHRLYRVSGEAPRKFLNGQLSQRLEDVSDTQSRRAAACNPKGRAYALMLLAGSGDDVLVQLPAAIAEDVMAHLNKFLMLFRKTEMAQLPHARVFGLWGQAAAERIHSDAKSLAQPGDSLSIQRDDTTSGKLIRVMDTAEGCPRFEYWHLASGSESAHLTNAALPADEQYPEADWLAAEISAGVSRLTPESASTYIPQMLNWQQLDGVHFNKGCYTGQEVIARMHFLGQLKKSVFRLACTNLHQAPETGTPIVAGDKAVGEVVNSVRFDDGHCEMLAVIKHSALNNPEWRLGKTDGEPLEKLPLPYNVPEQIKED